MDPNISGNISYSSPRRTIYGVNSLKNIKDIAGNNKKSILYLTYKNNGKNLPFHNEVLDLLHASSKNVFVYDEIEREPSIQNIDTAAGFAKKKNLDLILAVGGGSVIDLAKAVSILMRNEGSIRDFQMNNKKIVNKGVDLIAVPTTAGTGSEATAVVVVTNIEKKIKKSISHPYLVPDLVLLDPALTVTLPPGLTALTGIDALSHAIESYTSTLEIPFAKATAIKAIELIGKNLVESYKNPENLGARMDMLLASNLGGMSLIASVGAAHRLAQPISSETGLSHSEAISIILINVMKINRPYCMERYRDIASALGVDTCKYDLEEASKQAIARVIEIYKDLNISDSFSKYNIGSKVFSKIIDNANATTSHLKYNPRPLNEKILLKILELSK